MRLTIEMPWERDLSVNHCRMGPRGNWHIKPHVEAWMNEAGWLLKMGKNAPPFFDYEWKLPLEVTVDMRFPDKRKRDDHNYFYCAANAVAAGLGIDDKDIRISTGTIDVDRANPGFTITVEDSE